MLITNIFIKFNIFMKVIHKILKNNVDIVDNFINRVWKSKNFPPKKMKIHMNVDNYAHSYIHHPHSE